MGKIHKRGLARTKDDVKKRRKRPCISAPSAATNVTCKFKRTHRNRAKIWNARVNWDPVTTDVAGRDLPKNTDGNSRADGYQIELRATDSSGDPIDLPSDAEDPFESQGGDWIVFAGTAVTKIKSTELRIETQGGIVQTPNNLSNLTGGIQETVNFFARCETGTPNVKFEVWNQTDGTSVVAKTVSLADANLGKLVAKMKFTPSATKSYRLRATWMSGSGKPIITKVEYWDAAETMLWKKQANDEDTGILFKNLERPKAYFYQARVRARSNHHNHRCWSAWSAWTTAINPVTGNEAGPPAPTGLTLAFDKVGKKHAPFDAILTWNEMGWWIPPMGDPQEGAREYATKLACSKDGGGTTQWVRHQHRAARDNDADTTAEMRFGRGIRRDRWYRAAVRAKDHDGNWGAWSAWTSWDQVGGGPNNPLNVQKFHPRPRVLKWTWDEPTDSEDVDKYRIKIFCQGNLRDTDFTRSQHYRYHVPDADAGKSHSARVTAIDHEGNNSAEQDPGEINDDGTLGGEDIGSIKHYGGGSPPNGWHKCNGAALTTGAPFDQLFAVIGYTYGGSGSTFNVPDFRRRHGAAPDEVTKFPGNNEGSSDPAARELTHTHAQDDSADDEVDDETVDNEVDDFAADNEVDDIKADDEIEDNRQEATHGHFQSGSSTSGAIATTSVNAQGNQSVAGPQHQHTWGGQQTNSGNAHGHGHRHPHKHQHRHGHRHQHRHGHKHRHKHGHKHRHQHDGKNRPHLICHKIIKYA